MNSVRMYLLALFPTCFTNQINTNILEQKSHVLAFWFIYLILVPKFAELIFLDCSYLFYVITPTTKIFSLQLLMNNFIIMFTVYGYVHGLIISLTMIVQVIIL